MSALPAELPTVGYACVHCNERGGPMRRVDNPHKPDTRVFEHVSVAVCIRVQLAVVRSDLRDVHTAVHDLRDELQVLHGRRCDLCGEPLRASAPQQQRYCTPRCRARARLRKDNGGLC